MTGLLRQCRDTGCGITSYSPTALSNLFILLDKTLYSVLIHKTVKNRMYFSNFIVINVLYSWKPKYNILTRKIFVLLQIFAFQAVILNCFQKEFLLCNSEQRANKGKSKVRVQSTKQETEATVKLDLLGGFTPSHCHQQFLIHTTLQVKRGQYFAFAVKEIFSDKAYTTDVPSTRGLESKRMTVVVCLPYAPNAISQNSRSTMY